MQQCPDVQAFWVKNIVYVSLRICDVLRDLIPFVQFKKREKHPLRIITFSNAWKYNNIGIPSLFLSIKFLSFS